MRRTLLRFADWNWDWKSLWADPVDPEGHGGEDDALAGGGCRTRNLDALLQWNCPSMLWLVLPCRSYPVKAHSRETRNLRRRKPCKQAERRSPPLFNTAFWGNCPAIFGYSLEKSEGQPVKVVSPLRAELGLTALGQNLCRLRSIYSSRSWISNRHGLVPPPSSM